MHTRTLNLGILAHVDAGKTSLTERLLFDHGVIPRLGSVDAGTTQTDAGELERERGITIRAAVASLTIGDLQLNLVDTPGHPDFIAEVQRSLAVLDAVVLVISAVEGVQAQTRVLMRAVRSIGLPTILFVNKVDRRGARVDDLVDEIRRRLTTEVVVVNRPIEAGTPAVSVERETIWADVRVAGSTPVLFGSAVTGAGIVDLTSLISRIEPALVERRDDDALVGTAFAIERQPNGTKVGFVRLFAGELRARQQVAFHRADRTIRGRISELEVVGRSAARSANAGDIVRIRGIAELRIGDRLGESNDSAITERTAVTFAAPSLEAVVRARHPHESSSVYAALSLLADEDPLIRTRPGADGATAVLLYGEVQKEVLAERLRRQFGLEVDFERTTPIYLERVVGTGEALVELDPLRGNLHWATVGLRVTPSGTEANTFETRAERGAMPRSFHAAIHEAVLDTLRSGIDGREVVGCAVTVTCAAQLAPLSTAVDFRALTPIVLHRALTAAGTSTVEPCLTIEVTTPSDRLGEVIGLLASHHGDVEHIDQRDDESVVRAIAPARLLHDVAIRLPALTRGEGALWSQPAAPRAIGTSNQALYSSSVT